jgi:hypothetical protein
MSFPHCDFHHIDGVCNGYPWNFSNGLGVHTLSLLGDVTSYLNWCFGLERTHSSLVDGHG